MEDDKRDDNEWSSFGDRGLIEVGFWDEPVGGLLIGLSVGWDENDDSSDDLTPTEARELAKKLNQLADLAEERQGKHLSSARPPSMSRDLGETLKLSQKERLLEMLATPERTHKFRRIQLLSAVPEDMFQQCFKKLQAWRELYPSYPDDELMMFLWCSDLLNAMAEKSEP